MTLPTRTALFALYCLSVALVATRELGELYELASSDATASHLILVPLATLVLLVRDRQAIFSCVRVAWRPGVAMLVAGCALWYAGHRSHAGGSTALPLTFSVLAVVVWFIAGALLFYGTRAVKAASFPLLFLGFAVPPPSMLLDAATLVLKAGSTEVVDLLFAVVRIPYYREGFVFSLPNVTIEVADECSGIRSGIALLLTGVLAGHLFLTSRRAKLILIVIVLPIAILKNGFRIAVLSILSVAVDPGFLTGRLHHEGGPVFFLVALTALFATLILLRRWEAATPLAA